MALAGSRIPDSLRVFVLALAIIDDIGAILVIAVGYSHVFHPLPFAVALLGLAITALMRWLGVRPVVAYWLIGFLIWAAMHESGIHPTITGVALGLLTPAGAWIDENRLNRFLTWARRATAQREASAPAPSLVRRTLARAARESISPQQRLEDSLHPWSAFFVLPLFALANAGVPISMAGAFDSISIAVVAGLAIGKPVGILIFTWFAVKAGLARKPPDVSWKLVFAAGMLCGIGFTMALFIANLAFNGEALQSAKFGVMLGSTISGAIGLAALFLFARSSAGRPAS
jgi:NhaA family Na+:H+ antiporter